MTLGRPSKQVPVFRDGRRSGFAQRVATEPPTSPDATADDMKTQSRQRDALTQQLGLHSGRVGVTVKKGVVHLFGHADGSHEVLAARRVAAAAPDTGTIIDDLWIEYE
jgi:osmotically-inducible protein OsmY